MDTPVFNYMSPHEQILVDVGVVEGLNLQEAMHAKSCADIPEGGGGLVCELAFSLCSVSLHVTWKSELHKVMNLRD